jgi:hypothetical protein
MESLHLSPNLVVNSGQIVSIVKFNYFVFCCIRCSYYCITMSGGSLEYTIPEKCDDGSLNPYYDVITKYIHSPSHTIKN